MALSPRFLTGMVRKEVCALDIGVNEMPGHNKGNAIPLSGDSTKSERNSLKVGNLLSSLRTGTGHIRTLLGVPRDPELSQTQRSNDSRKNQ